MYTFKNLSLQENSNYDSIEARWFQRISIKLYSLSISFVLLEGIIMRHLNAAHKPLCYAEASFQKLFWLPFCCVFVLRLIHMLLYFVFGYRLWWGWGRKSFYMTLLYQSFVYVRQLLGYTLVFSLHFQTFNNVTTLPIIIVMWYLQIWKEYLSCWDIIVGHTQKKCNFSFTYVVLYEKEKRKHAFDVL